MGRSFAKQSDMHSGATRVCGAHKCFFAEWFGIVSALMVFERPVTAEIIRGGIIRRFPFTGKQSPPACAFFTLDFPPRS